MGFLEDYGDGVKYDHFDFPSVMPSTHVHPQYEIYFCPEDIAILGMGGELIVSIIDKAEWVKDKNIRLILQPMTHAHTLAKYLLDNGFSIVDERICATSSTRSDRIYRVICAEYSGNTEALSDAEYLVGKINTHLKGSRK